MENLADGLLERDDPAEDQVGNSLLDVAASVIPDQDFDWVGSLSGAGPVQDEAIRRLHVLMVRASRFKLARMGETYRLGQARAEALVQSSADDAVVAILSRLSTFEGRALFTTWAYKFAILHTATAVRRELWAHTEDDLSSIPELAARAGDPLEHVEGSALAEALRRGIAESLTAHQQRVLIAVAIDSVPIDVIADRLGTTRNTVYKTLHDARKRLRAYLTTQGYLDPSVREEVKR